MNSYQRCSTFHVCNHFGCIYAKKTVSWTRAIAFSSSWELWTCQIYGLLDLFTAFFNCKAPCFARILILSTSSANMPVVCRLFWIRTIGRRTIFQIDYEIEKWFTHQNVPDCFLRNRLTPQLWKLLQISLGHKILNNNYEISILTFCFLNRF